MGVIDRDRAENYSLVRHTMSEFLDDGDFERFRDLIYNESGIHFSESNRTILESRLKERLKIASLDTVRAYFDFVKRDREELKVLLDAVTTNLTRFWRNQAHWDTFVNYVIPDLIAYKRKKGDTRLRLWSAGCSTGEEPYTMAMVLASILPPGFQVEITASDISLKSVLTAKEAFYADSRIAGVPDDALKKYFERVPNGYRVIEPIRKVIKFDYHNLKNDSGLRNLDIVFCRNVLIYFDDAAQKVAVDRFWDSMSSHSFLFIGHSESLFGMETKFAFLKTDWACIYSKIIDR